NCIDQVRPSGRAANLGFVYVTDLVAGDLPAVLRRLRDGTGVDHWIGTIGMGICAMGAEFYDAPAISILLCRFPEESFRVFSAAAASFDADMAAHDSWLRSTHATFGIIHGDPGAAGLPQMIDGLSRRMGDGFLVGGLASSRSDRLYLADTITDRPLSGVLFSEGVAVTTRLTQGCSPLGGRHVVTQGDQNLVFTLDDAPALEVLKQEMGDELQQDLRRIGGYIFAGLPVRGSDTGDYLVRNILGIDPTHGVIAIADTVAPGDMLMFCRRDARTAQDDLVRMLGEIKPVGPPRGAVYFSCIARGRSQFGPDSRELRTIRQILGDVPLTGFFGNGEISHTRLYGYTGVLTLFL
ncbi:MAG: FIST signal transduction protein, partial [Gammaproteobacteria bacterium]